MYLRMDHSNFEVKIKTQNFEEFWGTQNGVEFRSNFEQGYYDACW